VDKKSQYGKKMEVKKVEWEKLLVVKKVNREKVYGQKIWRGKSCWVKI
jgi:hypothetical protein